MSGSAAASAILCRSMFSVEASAAGEKLLRLHPEEVSFQEDS
jgi:hypothetical protein